MTEKAFLLGMLEQPDDPVPRLVFADWLEERGDPRGELLRLTHALTQTIDCPDRRAREARLRALLAEGVRPVGPHWTNTLGMQFAWVAPGAFLMGSPSQEPERQDDETRHRVTLTKGFFLGAHPVTQAQWRAVLGGNPSRFPGDDRPVECVSWEDCREFCQALRDKDGLQQGLPSPYRLPTEAEWEYACRAGTTTPFASGEALTPYEANYLTNYRWDSGPKGKYRQETTPVGSFSANAWGLADLHGNVFEWCADWYAAYPAEAVTDPLGQKHANVRVLRGGSWHSLVGRCRSACRGWGAPGYRGSDVGCRVCFRMDYNYTI
jgi:uncharacterized protein (TIGR02996 family)